MTKDNLYLSYWRKGCPKKNFKRKKRVKYFLQNTSENHINQLIDVINIATHITGIKVYSNYNYI